MAVCTGCKEFFLKTEDDMSISERLNFPCPVCIRLAKLIEKPPKPSAYFCRKNCFAAHHKGIRHRNKHYFPIMVIPIEVRALILKYFTRRDWLVLACVCRDFVDQLKCETLKSLNRKYLLKLEEEARKREEGSSSSSSEEENWNTPPSPLPDPPPPEIKEEIIISQPEIEPIEHKSELRRIIRKPFTPYFKNLPENLDKKPELTEDLNEPGKVSDYYKQFIAQVDDVIEKTRVKQDVEWKLDPEILALLQASTSNEKPIDKNDDFNDWSWIIEDDIITGVKNSVTGIEKTLKLPVLLTPKILTYDAYEEL